MENEASQLVIKMNELLEKNDEETAWNMQGEIQRVRSSLPLYSEEREKITEVWEKMMFKWH
jgi:hypothetical protein